MCNTRASQISALTLSTRVPSCGSFVSQFSSSSSELSLTLASSLALSFQEARAQRGDLAHEVFVGHPKESENGGIFTSFYYLPVLAWVTKTLVETVMVYIFQKGLRAVNITLPLSREPWLALSRGSAPAAGKQYPSPTPWRSASRFGAKALGARWNGNSWWQKTTCFDRCETRKFDAFDDAPVSALFIQNKK